VQYRWLIGCAISTLGACGGVTRSSPGGDGGSTSAGTTSGGSTSVAGHTSKGGMPVAGNTSTGGTSAMQVPCGKTFCPAHSTCCNPVCGICGSEDGACPDIGCVAPPDTCATTPSAPAVLGCAQVGGTTADPNGSTTLSVPSGVVVGEGHGVLPGGCLERQLQARSNGPELAAQARNITVRNGNELWTVEVVVEAHMIPSLLGEKVSLSYLYKFGGFGPSLSQLSLVSLGSRSHGVWVAQGGELSELNNLPLLLTRGGVACSTTEQCGSYQYYDIVATDPLTMTGTNVPHGQSSAFGPWNIIHAGYAEQTSPSGCPDWFVANAEVAIFGLM
jgi:hypothetical protein